MITKRYESREEWEAAREGKITGSKLGKLFAKRGGRLIGFYQLIADRLAIPEDGDENAMNRGTRLEPEALEVFAKETGKEVDSSLLIWMREDNEMIAISPDGVIGETEAVEVKCLNPAHHIQALVTEAIPSDYEEQVLQYFIVNDKLERLYFVFYDPRVTAKPFFYHTVERSEVQDDVDKYLSMEKQALAEVNEIVGKLSEF